MKPIAIIAIIAAVVVVGGACAGVAFSGVLNGGTTGPGGDDPVVPTEPVDPTPTETPTETPTPTETQMSTFSPMTSSGSSSSGSGSSSGGNTPTGCEHAETELKSNNDGTHSQVCKECGVKVTTETCNYAHYQYTGTESTNTHSMLCDVCGHVGTAECTGAISHDEGANTHSEKCELCDAVIGETTNCFAEGNNGDWSPDENAGTHSRTCATEGCKHIYTEKCGITGEYVEHVANTRTHTLTGECDTCGRDATEKPQTVACIITNTSVSPAEDDIPKHTPKCDVCGQPYEIEKCTISKSYTQNNGMHTQTDKCAYCNYVKTHDAVTCNFGEPKYNLEGDNPTASYVCKDCDYVKTDNVVAAIEGIGYVTFEEAIKAVKAGETLVILKEDTYSISGAPAGITIDGNNKATIDNIYILNDDLIVENCEIVVDLPDSAHASQVYGSVTFKNCSFIGQGTGASLWIDTISDGSTVTFEKCTFSDYLKLGGGGAQNVQYIFNSCTFDSNGNENHNSHIRSYAPITLDDCMFINDDESHTSNVCLANGMDPSTSIEVKSNSALVSFGSSDDSRTIARVDANGIHVADIGEKGYASVEKAVNAAVDAGSTEEVKLMVAMIAPSTIADGNKVTINPNGKKILLTYEDITDIQIKEGLGAESEVKVVGSGEGAVDLAVVFSDTSEEGMLIVDYALSTAEMYICTADGLFTFADMVNNEGKTFKGMTVKLMNDIDLEDKEWTPIGQTGEGHVTFHGVFDGNEKTISNFKVDRSSITTANDAAGLFGWVEPYTGPVVIKDLTIKSADIAGNYFAGGIAGYIAGDGAEITNCHVDDSKITGAIKKEQVGGIVGHTNSGEITGCSVTNTDIYYNAENAEIEPDYRYAAAVVGLMQSSSTYGEGNTIDNVRINGVETQTEWKRL